MEHIPQSHMLLMQCLGKSYFFFTDVQYVLAIVKDTTGRTDTIMPHKCIRDRQVRQKKCEMQVGVHGITNVACYCVTIVFNVKNNEEITAFPTV